MQISYELRKLVLYTNFQLFGNMRKEQSDVYQVIDPYEQNSCHWHRGSGSTASAPVSDVSAPALHIWSMATSTACECGAEDQPFSMLSSDTQSINLPLDCTPWPFWMMRQLIVCSTPAQRSSTAKQWTKRTASNNEDEAACACVLWTFPSKSSSLFSFLLVEQTNRYKKFCFFPHSFSSPIPPWSTFSPRD